MRISTLQKNRVIALDHKKISHFLPAEGQQLAHIYYSSSSEPAYSVTRLELLEIIKRCYPPDRCTHLMTNQCWWSQIEMKKPLPSCTRCALAHILRQRTGEDLRPEAPVKQVGCGYGVALLAMSFFAAASFHSWMTAQKEITVLKAQLRKESRYPEVPYPIAYIQKGRQR